ncbi:MAG: DMT family transporter [Ruminococcaceae bacterium]|nr:DMT family transporter [Oscillospiraceae bacterium]
MSDAKTTALARLALLIATLIWGSSFVVLKSTLDFLPTNYVLAIRFTGACILLSLIFIRQFRDFTRDYLWRGLIIGICLYLAYFTQTVGLVHTTPGKNAFLTAVYCILVPFLFWLVDKKRPDRYHISAAVICLVGIGLVSLTGKLSLEFGDTMTLIGGFWFAAHIIAVTKLSAGKNPILITIIQFAGVAICSWAVALTTETLPAGWYENTLPSLGFLTVFCTAITLLLQNIGQKYLPPSNCAILLSLESVFGVIFSIIIFHEVMTVRLVTGFVLIFVAVIISETKLSFLKRKKEGVTV